jgi:hypothetical protein
MDRDRRGLRALAVLAWVATAATALVSVAWLQLFTCGGDGGEALYDREELQGRVCESGLGDHTDAWALAHVALPTLVSLGIGVLAARRREWRLAWLALVGGMALALGPTVEIEMLPG